MHPTQTSAALTRGGIAEDLRRASVWFAAPVGAASLFRVFVEPHYLSGWLVVWLLLIGLYAFAQRFLLEKPGDGRLRTALVFNFVAINVGFALIGCFMSAWPGWRADGMLNSIDRMILGCDTASLFGRWSNPWVGTLAVLGYSSFILFFLYLAFSEAFVLSAWTGKIQKGFMMLYGLGYSGYLLLPASGPIFAHEGKPLLLPQSHFAAGLNSWLTSCCLGVDAWPSLHAGVCLFTVVWVWRRWPKALAFFVPAGIALLFGALYLHYHYLVDILTGGALGIACSVSVLSEARRGAAVPAKVPARSPAPTGASQGPAAGRLPVPDAE
ncbi:MAG TPA: phosphatase PAP2 family protein [Opitutaceae bacterium]|jgi:hypothetical protein